MGARVVVTVTLALAMLDLDAYAGPNCEGEARALRAHLTREASRADTWTSLWALGFAAAAVGQIVLADAEANPFGEFDAAYRGQLYVGAIKASLGLGSKLVVPLRIRVPPRVPDPDLDQCEDARRLRKALATAADKERKSILLTIIGGTAVNLGGSIWLWIRHDFKTAATSFLVGAPVGPISALTQPRGSMRLHKKQRIEWVAGLGWIGGSF